MLLRSVSGIAVALLVLTAIASDAQSVTNPRDAAYLLEQQGKTDEAEAAWRSILRVHPADAEAYAHLGLLEAHQEHYQEAITDYQRALALNPAIQNVKLDLGLSFFKAGELRKAIQTFEPILKAQSKSSPESLRLITLIGLAHYGLGEYAAAVPYLKQATTDDPQNLPFRLALAQSCLWSKQYRCVLDVYHEILLLNADSAEADMLAGEALDEMKDKPGALQQFRAAAKADPKLPNVHFGLGYLLWGLLRYDEAAKEFQAELANNPDHAQALTYLADSDIKMGRPAAAEPLLKKAIQIDPKIELAHLDLGILEGDAGRRDEALRELKTAERLEPGDQNVHWRLGRYYRSIGKNEEAKIEFDKTKSLQKAADQTVFRQLHGAQSQEKAVQLPGIQPTSNQ